jgi:hypothetical protein
MGRPENFSREEVLEMTMPVFWEDGFVEFMTALRSL